MKVILAGFSSVSQGSQISKTWIDGTFGKGWVKIKGGGGGNKRPEN
jgi:hypothetical protein